MIAINQILTRHKPAIRNTQPSGFISTNRRKPLRVRGLAPSQSRRRYALRRYRGEDRNRREPPWR